VVGSLRTIITGVTNTKEVTQVSDTWPSSSHYTHLFPEKGQTCVTSVTSSKWHLATSRSQSAPVSKRSH